MQDFRTPEGFLSLQIWPHAVRGQVLFSLLPKNWVTTILLILLIGVESTKDLLWLFSFCCYWTFFCFSTDEWTRRVHFYLETIWQQLQLKSCQSIESLKVFEVVTDRDVVRHFPQKILVESIYEWIWADFHSGIPNSSLVERLQ